RTLQNMAFPFVRVAPRASKPRDEGLTVVADRGVGMHRVEDLLETAGEFIDYVKIGIGVFRLQTEALLKRKIKAFQRAGVSVFLAGDVTEAAAMQGMSRQFYREVKRFGADAVEVSSAQVTLSLADKCELIRMASKEGLKVVAEAGQKGHENWTDSQAFVFAQVRAYQKAGAWKVLVQGEGISEGVEEMKHALILNLVSQFDVQDFIFQAKDGATQTWYVGTFGNSVNLDVDDHQVLDLELMRRGIRKRGVFGLIGSL
ncbi:MAG: phosphosulfolactate synthase, partial [Gammaproteobacteria bacterium]|nr:phosphosulfolactate synthase [Gammaproteobacteria bacterium]